MKKVNIDDLKRTGYEVPTMYEYKNYIILHLVIDEQIVNNKKLYTWLELYVNKSNYIYENIVQLLISFKYTNSEVIAIMNNYMFDPNDEKYKQEFDDLQNWRFKVKNSVKKHFNML